MDNSQTEVGTNPIVAIGTAIGVASIMVLITFIFFLNSSAYITVKQIQAGTNFARSIKMDGYDTKSPIKADTLESYQLSVDQRLKTINDTSDFGADEISDTSLGLR